ncbi:MAG TPA: hypothetical protein VHV49_14655 [Pseudonocardiaceae bacterium]|jgi:hypothetical protein|nr:hypothetical protein [Pseudonocardiaceae bacterium]
MHVPPAFQRSDDIALLAELADPESGPGQAADRPDDTVLLDGRRVGYLVAQGRVDLVAVRWRVTADQDQRGHHIATLGQGAVIPSSTALGAWQLAVAPNAGTRLRPLNTGRLRAIGYGEPSAAPNSLVPVPRAVSVVVAALARGLDVALIIIADALRTGQPPPHAMPIGPGQFMSLDAGAAVTADGGVCWLRVAGGHARRNGEGATVFGGAEPALLAGHDWIAVDGPATAEATTTADLLATGHLPAALDQHMVLTLRSIEQRLDES